MNDSSRLFFTGNTLEQAVLTAATHYELEPDELAYERVERRTGFLRGRKRVVIRVDSSKPRLMLSEPPMDNEPEQGAAEPELLETQADFNLHDLPPQHLVDSQEAETERSGNLASNQERPERTERPKRERRPRPSQEDHSHPVEKDELLESSERQEAEEWTPPELPKAAGPAADAAEQGVEMLAQMADLEITAEVFEGEDQLVVELSGEDQRRLVHNEGRLLLAIQHLLPRMIHGLTGEMSPCRVDSHGFRDMRVADLERLARRTAEEVGNSGHPQTLRSMSPADRRTIHMALKDDDEVATESEGHGFFKRITVRPA